jgi:hypothetical protein
MKKYILLDGNMDRPEMTQISSHKDGKYHTIVFGYTTTAATITDHGNGWTYTMGDKEIELDYSQVADIVTAFLIFQKEGRNLANGTIYKAIADVPNNRSKP